MRLGRRTPIPAMSGSAPLAQSPFSEARLSNVTHSDAMWYSEVDGLARSVGILAGENDGGLLLPR